MFIFSLLIYIVSLVLQSPVLLNIYIYNRCQNINLTSLIYFTHDERWHKVPYPKADVIDVMRNRVEFGSGQNILEEALIYRLQKIQYAESDKFVHNESKKVQLLVAWRVEHTRELHARALLVEYVRKLNEDRLRRLYQKCRDSLKVQINPIRNNWILDDTTVLTTRIRAMDGGYGWDILISKGAKNNVERPLRINVKK
jgi:hypothetical protein